MFKIQFLPQNITRSHYKVSWLILFREVTAINSVNLRRNRQIHSYKMQNTKCGLLDLVIHVFHIVITGI